MNLLFIANKHHNFCGGEACTQRNLTLLQRICGTEHVTEIRIVRNQSLKEKHRLLWLAQGLANDLRQCSISGIDKEQSALIHRTIREKEITSVFIDKSLLGMLAKEIRALHPHVRIITFFHNIEYLYYKRELELNGKWPLRYRLPIIRRNEEAACLYSDTIITLNNRDNELLKEVYGREAEYTLPITLEDRYTPVQTLPSVRSEHPNILFVGSYFSMNIEGIRHFVTHILPHTKARLTIAGSGMKNLKDEFKTCPQVCIYDFVPDLTKLYEEASFVVIPIYSGSGMKVKTAEALMYGKYIIGTPEAFTGYDIPIEAGQLCTDDKAFIQAINTCTHWGYNPPSRELFIQKYRNETCLTTIKDILNR